MAKISIAKGEEISQINSLWLDYKKSEKEEQTKPKASRQEINEIENQWRKPMNPKVDSSKRFLKLTKLAGLTRK